VDPVYVSPELLKLETPSRAVCVVHSMQPSPNYFGVLLCTAHSYARTRHTVANHTVGAVCRSTERRWRPRAARARLAEVEMYIICCPYLQCASCSVKRRITSAAFSTAYATLSLETAARLSAQAKAEHLAQYINSRCRYIGLC